MGRIKVGRIEVGEDSGGAYICGRVRELWRGHLRSREGGQRHNDRKVS